MQIRVSNGNKTIKLDKSERAAMVKAKEVAAELERQGSEAIKDAAYNARIGLGNLLAEFPERAAQAAPEPATTGK